MVGAALLAAGCATGSRASCPAPRDPARRKCASARRGTRRSIARSTPRACVTPRHARVAGFPAPAGRSLPRRVARARRRERAARCARTRSASPSSTRRRGATRFRTCRRCRPRRRAPTRCAARATAAGLLRDADLASHDGARRAAGGGEGAGRAFAPWRAASEEAWQRRTLTVFQTGAATRRCSACAMHRPSGQRLPRNVIAGLLGRATFDPLGHLAPYRAGGRAARGHLCADLRDRDARRLRPLRLAALAPRDAASASRRRGADGLRARGVHALRRAPAPPTGLHALVSGTPGARYLRPGSRTAGRRGVARDARTGRRAARLRCDSCLRLLPRFLPDRARATAHGAATRHPGCLRAAAPAAASARTSARW